MTNKKMTEVEMITELQRLRDEVKQLSNVDDAQRKRIKVLEEALDFRGLPCRVDQAFNECSYISEEIDELQEFIEKVNVNGCNERATHALSSILNAIHEIYKEVSDVYGFYSDTYGAFSYYGED